MFKTRSRLLQKRHSFFNSTSYNFSEQLLSSIVICTLSLIAFLPYILNKRYYDEDPNTPYSDGSGEVLMDVTNAALVSCMMMMCIEALLDSNTLYLPIKIVFPRFLMVFGVLGVSLSFYFVSFDGTDRLHYLVCMLFAKGYFIAGGLTLKLVADAVAAKSCQWVVYILSAVVYTADFMMHQWSPFYPPDDDVQTAKFFISLCSFTFTLFFVYKIFQLLVSKNNNTEGSYDVMSHVVVCVFYYGTIIVKFSYTSKTWKETTASEIAGYNFVGLFATVLFFFTSSHIAQRHFVRAKGQLINKKSFVRYVSHEIRTPLNTVYLGIQLLSKELNKLGSTEAKQNGGEEAATSSIETTVNMLKDVVNDISESCFVSINILNDLLLIDKIEEGQLKLDMKAENAKDLLEPCIQNFGVQAMYSNVNLAVDLEAVRQVTINVDEPKIVQVVRNIVSNALKFTPSGGHIQVKSYFLQEPASSSTPRRGGVFNGLPPNAIYVDEGDDDGGNVRGKIRIEFLDTGPGISEDNKAKLFENVIQFDSNILQNGGGSGLGLFISNAIMKRHPMGRIGVMSGGVAVEGGTIEDGVVRLVSSTSTDRGCGFFIEMEGIGEIKDEVVVKPVPTTTLTFPKLGPSESSENLVHAFSPREVVENVSKLFPKVLVVEDSKFNRKMMRKALTNYVKEIVMAEDGVEAVAAVRKCLDEQEPPFDVIFMDSLMPNMNGITATKIIIGELGFSNPIIAVTGNMLPEDVREFEDAGVLTVLGKPLDLDHLEKVLTGISEEKVYYDHREMNVIHDNLRQ